MKEHRGSKRHGHLSLLFGKIPLFGLGQYIGHTMNIWSFCPNSTGPEHPLISRRNVQSSSTDLRLCLLSMLRPRIANFEAQDPRPDLRGPSEAFRRWRLEAFRRWCLPKFWPYASRRSAKLWSSAYISSPIALSEFTPQYPILGQWIFKFSNWSLNISGMAIGATASGIPSFECEVRMVGYNSWR